MVTDLKMVILVIWPADVFLASLPLEEGISSGGGVLGGFLESHWARCIMEEVSRVMVSLGWKNTEPTWITDSFGFRKLK